jgi:thiamine-phosphate diphosphorylase
VSVLPRPAICLVTDRRQLTPAARTVHDEIVALENFLDAAVDAGVDAIQIRELDLDAGVLGALTARVVARAGAGPVQVLVNDRADVACAANAHGVHLRADGPPIAAVRSFSHSWTIGRSVHDGDDLALYQDADYLIFGTVFETRSKPAGPVAGVAALGAAVAASRVPVLAIGGVTPVRAVECGRAGAAGVAAIGVFLPEGRVPEALGVRRAVAELRAAFEG